MTVAEWIIMAILAATLFIFLVLGIVLLVKLIKFTNSLNRMVSTGQRIADNVRGFTTASVSGLVGNFFKDYTENKQANKKGGQKNGSK